MKLTALIPIYHKESIENIERCLNNIKEQTQLPDEVLLVCDKDLTEGVCALINSFDFGTNKKILNTNGNYDLGETLRRGVAASTFPYVARVDTDDISNPKRFESQMNFLRDNPDVDLVGCNVIEVNTSGDFVAYKKFPEFNYQILKFSKSRCPVAHMGCIYKRNAVLNSGNYESFLGIGNEDYLLWARMLQSGYKFYNLQNFLVTATAGSDLVKRRTGAKFAYNELMMQIRFYQIGFVSFLRLLLNVFTRIPFIIVPSCLKVKLFYLFFRSKNE